MTDARSDALGRHPNAADNQMMDNTNNGEDSGNGMQGAKNTAFNILNFHLRVRTIAEMILCLVIQDSIYCLHC